MITVEWIEGEETFSETWNDGDRDAAQAFFDDLGRVHMYVKMTSQNAQA